MATKTIAELDPATVALLTHLYEVYDPAGTPKSQRLTGQQLYNLFTGGPRVYRAFLTQTGENAPVATIIQNSLGFNPTWSRLDSGDYLLIYTGGFPAGKCAVRVDVTLPTDPVSFNLAARANDDSVELQTWDNITTSAVADGRLNGTYFEVLIFP